MSSDLHFLLPIAGRDGKPRPRLRGGAQGQGGDVRSETGYYHRAGPVSQDRVCDAHEVRDVVAQRGRWGRGGCDAA